MTLPRVSLLECSVPKKSPLDLHVLGTPPAFVLSQDQTLKLISYLRRDPYLIILSLTQKNSVINLHCLVFKDHFPLWKFLRYFSYYVGVSAADLFYVTTSSNRCQYCFSWFFVVICAVSFLSVFAPFRNGKFILSCLAFSVNWKFYLPDCLSMPSVLCLVLRGC